MAKVRGSFDPHHARINCSEQKLPYSCGNVYRFERMHSCSSTRWRYTIQFAKVSAVNAYYIIEPEVTFRGHLTTFAHVLLIKPWGREVHHGAMELQLGLGHLPYIYGESMVSSCTCWRFWVHDPMHVYSAVNTYTCFSDEHSWRSTCSLRIRCLRSPGSAPAIQTQQGNGRCSIKVPKVKCHAI